MGSVERLRAKQVEVERHVDALSVSLDELLTNEAMPEDTAADLTFAWNQLSQSLSTIRQTLDELTVEPA